MSENPIDASLPRRGRTAEAPPRRRALAAALALSAGAHVGLGAMLWAERPPRADAGRIATIEIVATSGIANAASRTSTAAISPGGTQGPARPNAAPPRSHATPPAPPETTRDAPLPPAPPQREASAIARPPPPGTRVDSGLRLRRATAVRPPPMPSVAPPKAPARTARASRPPAPPSLARTPIIAADAPDAAPGSGPGAAQEQGVTPPRYGFGSASNPLPRYPETARERGWEGVVLLTVSVAADGRADAVRVSRSSGHEILDRAALAAVRRWRFQPGRRAGIAVAATAEVPIRFRLED